MLLFGFTLDDVIAWLRSKQPTDSCGLSNHCNSCPIAEFLVERLGGTIQVYSEYSTWTLDDGTRVEQDNPEWVQEFVAPIDKLSGWPGELFPTVTAEYALQIAEGVKECQTSLA